ncbi:MAG: filamentous hemagglutinin N-terminal domain-containing protein [Gammaproteobacteria bacterium]|nr:filamentous hemagglutinin N-terminal domain-containing protein [Gammaproteobacteria bacterium]MBU1601891.1 filamentous hemagglutinin N-terminal domain-containing protein [Gammaproteobacteria bacterium]MBU2432263.1 filamentous hemagglutinin N-terminal domain-containing protein [Gammaproteobacteria bacterium]MBU2450344.1 filamentous hemagglutinin N-terminal domain-containing protein [Gammaproteobacteria bacterium]
MNKTFRSIWNEAIGAWVAVAEIARRRGKRSTMASRARSGLRATIRPLALALAGIGLAHAAPPAANQLPTGGQVVAGQAAISQAGATMNIIQTSSRAAIDWQTFNVGSAATVNIAQPSASSVTLNRVLGGSPSEIFGHISAPGQVFLVNPGGVYFSPSASVDVGGLVATTHAIGNDDFMAGRDRFTRDGATGSIINDGQLTASLGGYIALLAPEVRNNGVIVAQLGTVALAAGEAYELQFDGKHTLSNIRVEAASIKALVDNGNAVLAPGGLIILSAQAADHLQGGVVNNSGLLEAGGLVDRGGTIRLEASDRIAHSGSIKADAAANSGGSGGTITLIADLGNADSLTEVSGDISARGGNQGGDGGFVETSAARVTIGDGTRVDTRAPQGKTGRWLIDPNDYTVAASGGDITGATLSGNLGTSDITLQSGNGASGSNGDININDSVSWSADTTLILNAYRNININGSITATGNSGKLALLYGQGAVAAGNGSDYFVNAAVNLHAGSNFSTTLGSDGAVINYTVITSLGAEGSRSGTDLQGMYGNLAGHYALGGNIDAAATSGWNAGAGFTPVGDTGHHFTGSFDGLGHTISNLTINLGGANIGLFRITDAGAILQNVGLIDGNITGNNQTGALVGTSDGMVRNSYATGSVSGLNYVGGLVGLNSANGTVSASYATNAVTGRGSTGYVGGLIGSNTGLVDTTYATGTTSATNRVGGLVGNNDSGGTISNSYSSGSVTATFSYAGGLVGYNTGTGISNSHATGNVNGNSYVGGLVGYNTGSSTISNSYAMGNVSSASINVGGLIGYHVSGTVSNSYATGNVSGTSNVGGLIGYDSSGNVTTSYASGAASGTGVDIGGLIGHYFSGTISDTYWNSTLNASGVGYNPTSGATGLTTTQMQTASNFTNFNFTTNPGASGNNWVMLNTAGGLNSGTGTLPMLASEYSTSITNAHQLQLMAMDLTASYSLAANIDASRTNNQDVWKSSGFIPIGNASNNFTGTFDGLGHTVSNLTINLPTNDDVGLIGVANGAVIGNLVLTGESVTGRDNVGGLIGTTVVGTLSNSHTTGGQVTGRNLVGGLVGSNNTMIVNASHSSNSVSGQDKVGGLMGWTNGGVWSANDYASGDVTGTGNYVGGLIGYNDFAYNIQNAYAAGAVTGANYVGGLVGFNLNGTITNSYATGAVAGGSKVGGLVGYQQNDATISYSYAIGVVTGSTEVGGLLGNNSSTVAVVDSFFSSDSNPALPGIATGLTTGVTAKTDAELKARTTYPSSWDFATANNEIWNIDSGVNNGYPFLCGINGGCVVQSLTTPLYLRLITGSSYYGDTPNLIYAFYDASSGGNVISDANPSGSIIWSTPLSATSDVGTYSETYSSGITVGNSAYTLNAGGAIDWLITPRPLDLSVSKTYDGNANFGAGFVLSGMVNGDAAPTISGSASVASANAANYASFSASSLSLSSANYSLSGGSVTLTIAKAHLTVTADDQRRLYGQANPVFTQTLSGFVNGETASVVSGAATGSSSATESTGVGSVTIVASLGSLSAGNYDFTATNGTLTIDPAAPTTVSIPIPNFEPPTIAPPLLTVVASVEPGVTPEIRVDVPADTGLARSFSFTVPPATADVAIKTESGSVKASLADGSSLPPWISFDAETQVFTLTNAPAGALPEIAVTFYDSDGNLAHKVIVVLSPAVDQGNAPS